eukprot:GHUV01023199.1.p1 GENE.GHUV01023199.1~~GHUV01023199.1.p1  ORF type:complete len:168 (+),score=32.34 GHUV01023199.1:172-675(+)
MINTRKRSSDGSFPPGSKVPALLDMQQPLLPRPTALGLQRSNSGTQRPRSTGKNRTISPAIDLKRAATLASAALNQPPAAARQKDKFVPLGQTVPQPEAVDAPEGSRSKPWPIAESQLTVAQRGGGVDGDAKARPAPTIFEVLTISAAAGGSVWRTSTSPRAATVPH